MNSMTNERVIEKYWQYIDKEYEIERSGVNIFFDPEYRRIMRNRQRYMREIIKRNLNPNPDWRRKRL